MLIKDDFCYYYYKDSGLGIVFGEFFGQLGRVSVEDRNRLIDIFVQRVECNYSGDDTEDDFLEEEEFLLGYCSELMMAEAFYELWKSVDQENLVLLNQDFCLIQYYYERL
jgi:hypothetical protein